MDTWEDLPDFLAIAEGEEGDAAAPEAPTRAERVEEGEDAQEALEAERAAEMAAFLARFSPALPPERFDPSGRYIVRYGTLKKKGESVGNAEQAAATSVGQVHHRELIPSSRRMLRSILPVLTLLVMWNWRRSLSPEGRFSWLPSSHLCRSPQPSAASEPFMVCGLRFCLQDMIACFEAPTRAKYSC